MKTHRKASYTEEIEMLKVVYCIWFVESRQQQQADNRARYYSRAIIPLKALTKHTYTCSLNYFMNIVVVAPIT